jgi:apolipoprotein N-acyltransferase
MEADPATWGALRAQVRRIGGPLRERGFTRRGGVSLWSLQDATCRDDDCRLALVRCFSEGGCDVFPEAQHYDKIVPLPFGEYLPFGDTFPVLREWIRGPGAFKAGTEALVFDNGRVRFGTPICYEGILDYVCDRFDDVDLLVNVTNDAWFGRTQASRLHGMLVAARAVELGVPVFRSAYSGLSFVVEPHGRFHAETDLFEAVSRPVEVRLARFDTFYRRFGDWFTAVCAALLLGLLAARRR